MTRCATATLILAVAACVAIGGPAAALARENAGSSAADALLRGGVGARAAALGGAYTAAVSGPLALRYNPAALGLVGRQSVFLGYDNALLDINRSDAAYARPWGRGGGGILVTVIDYGAFTRTTTANKVNAGTFSAGEYLARGGYGWLVGERLALGGSISAFQLSYDDEDATGFAADGGLLWWPGPEGLRMAAAFRNLGRGPKFRGTAEDLPLTGVIGASYRPGPWWLFTMEYEQVRNQGGAVRAGVELTPVSVLALRAGFDGRNDAGNGLSVGFGVAVGDLKLDYAYVPYGELDQSHRVSAEFNFGPDLPRPEPRGEARATRIPSTPSSTPPPRVESPRSPPTTSPQPLPTRPVRPPKDEPAPVPAATSTPRVSPPPEPARPVATPVTPAPVRQEPVRIEPARTEPVRPEPTRPSTPAPSASSPAVAAQPSSSSSSTDEQTSSMRRVAPGDPAAPYMARAAEAAAAGNEEAEMSWYRRVLATWPDHVIAHYNLATLHYLRGEWRLAKLHYLEVVTREREDGEAWLYLAVSESRLGNRREAREALQRVLVIDPSNPWARRALGRP